MRDNLFPLALTMGDPAGVGPQITWKAWAARRSDQRPFYSIAPPALLDAARLRADVSGDIAIIDAPSQAAAAFTNALPVLAIEGPAPPAGSPNPASAAATIESIRLAVEHVQAGQAAAVVTNPIAKALLYRAGFTHPGHTEYLAQLAAAGGAAPRPVMMLVGGGLRVALATIHIPLKSVSRAINGDLIEETVRITDAALRRDFGIAAPRIGLCGLNPHAGEGGGIGGEENKIINPAAAVLRAAGVDISDARPGDTIFHEALQGRFDAVIALYHDQGLIPVKTLDTWGGVNVTLGLPFIRTSPDHGTAYDAAASGVARADSLIAALDLADAMARCRTAAT